MTEGVRYDPHKTDLKTIRDSGVVTPLPKGVLVSTPFTSNKLSPTTESAVKESHPFKDPNVSSNKIRAKLNRR